MMCCDVAFSLQYYYVMSATIWYNVAVPWPAGQMWALPISSRCCEWKFCTVHKVMHCSPPWCRIVQWNILFKIWCQLQYSMVHCALQSYAEQASAIVCSAPLLGSYVLHSAILHCCLLLHCPAVVNYRVCCPAAAVVAKNLLPHSPLTTAPPIVAPSIVRIVKFWQRHHPSQKPVHNMAQPRVVRLLNKLLHPREGVKKPFYRTYP